MLHVMQSLAACSLLSFPVHSHCSHFLLTVENQPKRVTTKYRLHENAWKYFHQCLFVCYHPCSETYEYFSWFWLADQGVCLRIHLFLSHILRIQTIILTDDLITELHLASFGACGALIVVQDTPMSHSLSIGLLQGYLSIDGFPVGLYHKQSELYGRHHHSAWIIKEIT